MRSKKSPFVRIDMKKIKKKENPGLEPPGFLLRCGLYDHNELFNDSIEIYRSKIISPVFFCYPMPHPAVQQLKDDVLHFLRCIGFRKAF